MDEDQWFPEDFRECEPSQKVKMTKVEKQEIKDQEFQAQKPQMKLKKQLKQKELKKKKLEKLGTQEEIEAYYKEKAERKKFKLENGIQAQQSKYRVVIDCAFKEEMGEREQKSLARQLSELYAENRQQKHPIKLYITNIYPQLRQYLDKYYFDKWAVTATEKEFYQLEEFADANMIYMSPDSDQIIDEISEDVVYIIGGLVDIPIIKNATINRANLVKVKAAKFPIGHMIKPSFKKCLNVSTAALLIPGWLQYRDWQTAFDKIVPAKFTKQDEPIQQIQQQQVE